MGIGKWSKVINKAGLVNQYTFARGINFLTKLGAFE